VYTEYVYSLQVSNFILYSDAIWRILTISVTAGLCSNSHAERVQLTLQESPDDARVTRDSAFIPRWPSAAILDIIELEIVPFDQSTPKTLPGTRHGVDGCTVCEILAFKLYCNLETGIRGHSRSSKAASLDLPTPKT